MKRFWVGAVALVLVVLVGLVWAIRTPADPAAPPSQQPTMDRAESRPTPAQPTPQPSSKQLLPALPVTSDPNEYASAVASVVFGLDTTVADPGDYRALLMAEADPLMSPRGRADLERMVAERIPDPVLWERMRSNRQWSSWQTEDVWQPGAWDEVVTSGLAEPGWAVRNVLGQQTTYFHEGGGTRSTSRERTITIGVRCPDPGAQVSRCHLSLIGIGVVS